MYKYVYILRISQQFFDSADNIFFSVLPNNAMHCSCVHWNDAATALLTPTSLPFGAGKQQHSKWYGFVDCGCVCVVLALACRFVVVFISFIVVFYFGFLLLRGFFSQLHFWARSQRRCGRRRRQHDDCSMCAFV